jgi:GDPmannose 4,6-dehydratase
MPKSALITGITGQDGSYLAELLLDRGYDVHGLVRRSSSFNTARIDHIYNSIEKHYGDLTDACGLNNLVSDIMPNELYNFGAQSHVKVSFDVPVYTTESIAIGTLNLLEIVRRYPSIKLYQASSSEMFGSSPPPQNEGTQFLPQSSYASAKVNAYHNARLYREAYGLFICNGILFNHESERRGGTFVTRKVTRAATRIKLGLQDKLLLGNLEAKRDWGHAKDYVKAMYLMMQHDTPDDFVIATGESHSVQELVEYAFDLCELDWKEYVEIHHDFVRPADVNYLCGDYSKAKRVLGWEPTVDFYTLIKSMVACDMALARNEKLIREAVS